MHSWSLGLRKPVTYTAGALFALLLLFPLCDWAHHITWTWFWDLDIYLRAAERLIHSQPLYDSSEPLPYIYLPIWARGLAVILRNIGEPAFIATYIGLNLASLFLLFIRLVKVPDFPKLYAFIFFFGLVSVDCLISGNISPMLYLLLLTALLLLPQHALPFMLATSLACAFKVQYGVFLLVILILPVAHKWRYACAGAVLCIAPYALSFIFDPENTAAWMDSLRRMSQGNDVGYGFLKIAQSLAMPTNAIWFLAATYSTYAALLIWSARRIVKSPDIPEARKPWLVMLIAILLLLRLKEYDLYLVGPGFYFLASYLNSLWSRERRVFTWLCCLAALSPACDWSVHLYYLATSHHWGDVTYDQFQSFMSAAVRSLVYLSVTMLLLSGFRPKSSLPLIVSPET